MNLMGRMLQLCFTLEGLSRAVLQADFSHLSWMILSCRVTMKVLVKYYCLDYRI
jgi:hypothetical protein